MPWQKGVSGNPKGRPKDDPEVKYLARQYTREALNRLLYWLRSKNSSASVHAAVAILDRGWGKPKQEITGADGGPVEITIRWVRDDEAAVLERIDVVDEAPPPPPPLVQ